MRITFDLSRALYKPRSIFKIFVFVSGGTSSLPCVISECLLISVLGQWFAAFLPQENVRNSIDRWVFTNTVCLLGNKVVPKSVERAGRDHLRSLLGLKQTPQRHLFDITKGRERNFASGQKVLRQENEPRKIKARELDRVKPNIVRPMWTRIHMRPVVRHPSRAKRDTDFGSVL